MNICRNVYLLYSLFCFYFKIPAAGSTNFAGNISLSLIKKIGKDMLIYTLVFFSGCNVHKSERED